MMDETKLTQIILKIRDEILTWEEPHRPTTYAQINNGWCADFADAVWRECQRQVEVWNDNELGDIDYAHTFLKFNNLYYDAECPYGVLNWRDLPFYSRR